MPKPDMDVLRAAWKFTRSFFKSRSRWELSDYPIRIRHVDTALEPGGRLGPPFTWSAQIINWWTMSGHGYSVDEAMQSLAANFARRAGEPDPLPRPGTKVPLTFASDDRVRQHEALAADFFDRILGLRYEECFISDQSSLWNFHEEESNDFLFKKVLDVYGVDISDLELAILADIFERIASRSTQALRDRPLQPTSGANSSGG